MASSAGHCWVPVSKGIKVTRDGNCGGTWASFNLGELAMSFFSKMCKTASWMVRKNMDELISSSKNAHLSSLSRKPSGEWEQNQSIKWPAGLEKWEIVYPEHTHWVDLLGGTVGTLHCSIYWSRWASLYWCGKDGIEVPISTALLDARQKGRWAQAVPDSGSCSPELYSTVVAIGRMSCCVWSQPAGYSMGRMMLPPSWLCLLSKTGS